MSHKRWAIQRSGLCSYGTKPRSTILGVDHVLQGAETGVVQFYILSRTYTTALLQ